ncbi:hypothetical protein F5X98DRAFT_376480 [Xylaria grammica]|nr:hypothetical protein F5X98DRAFT_376480 [Xylaria grammica]
MDPNRSGFGENRGGRGVGHEQGARVSGSAEDIDTGAGGDNMTLTVSGSRHDISRLLKELPGRQFAVNLHPERTNALLVGSSSTLALAGTKRSSVTGGPDPKKLKTIHKDGCRNCGEKNHRAAFCIKAGKSGWMETCPKCGSKKHLYELCPRRVKGSEDFIYLIYNRQRKPPVKSRMTLGNVIRAELARPGTPWSKLNVLELPYSSEFAKHEALQNTSKSYTYPYVGNPTKEAAGRIPDPGRARLTIKQILKHDSVVQQSWSEKEERVALLRGNSVPTNPILPASYGHVSGHHGYGSTATNQANSTRSSFTTMSQFPPSRSSSIPSSVKSGGMVLREVICFNCGQSGHPVRHCDQGCLYCMHFSEDDEPHTVSECPVICHYCLLKDHTMANCEKAKRPHNQCERCGEHGNGRNFHLQAQCIWNWCPNGGCESRLGCASHCTGCGWNLNQINASSHECRFRKVWGGVDEVGKPIIKLQCLNNEDHQFRHGDLLAIRATVLEETKAGKWPVECPMCRKG